MPEILQPLSLEIAINIHEKGFTILKTISDGKIKSEKIATFCRSKLPIWCQNWVAGSSMATPFQSSLLPGRVTAV